VQDTDIPDVTRYRYQPWSHPGQAIPEPDGRQRIIVTLGTFDNPEAAGQIRLAAAAGQDAGAQVLAVLGNQDRRSIDDFRAGVHVLDWIDLPAAIATSDLVIHHGGAGTSWATLAAGRPAVVMPQMGDQFRNAALLQQSGVAITLGDIKLNPAALSEAIHTSLHDPDLTASARSLAAANHELPDTTELAERIVLLTTPET
jgi:UDP:flavonoid glycosyltransferase YjiC (YdhE family)